MNLFCHFVVVAQELQAKVFPSLIVPTSGGQLDPASNHYGAWKGGAGLCMLAIMGDRGVDDSIVARSLRMLERNAKRTLKVGFGETGYFYEGTHCGRISGNTGLFQYLQALKVAAGRDLLTNEAPGKWLCVKWIYELLRQNGKIDSK